MAKGLKVKAIKASKIGAVEVKWDPEQCWSWSDAHVQDRIIDVRRKAEVIGVQPRPTLIHQHRHGEACKGSQHFLVRYTGPITAAGLGQ